MQTSIERSGFPQWFPHGFSAARTRIRGAKERAIAPGPRLDRHPDEEEVGARESPWWSRPRIKRLKGGVSKW